MEPTLRNTFWEETLKSKEATRKRLSQIPVEEKLELMKSRLHEINPQRQLEETKMKISVFVDGANFFYMQRDGLQWFADAKKILDWIRRKGEIVDAFYYIGEDVPPEVKQQNYLTALTYMGYSLVTKTMKSIIQSDGTEIKKANLDIEIVLDMFNTIENYDMAVLISGDGDFERPLQLLRARGKRFLVMSTTGFVARELREVAGMHYIDFKDIRGDVEKQK
jgi:uncharacterized LabA/DUF88 family protein